MSVSRRSRVPRAPASARVKDPACALYPLTQSGYAGSGRSGVQAGSATVAGLPSVSASVIAVSGRQKPVLQLRVPHRDQCVRGAHVYSGEHPGGVNEVQVPYDNLVPKAGVELGHGIAGIEQRGRRLLRRPLRRGRRAQRLTSLKSRVYAADVSAAGGPGSPNCFPLRTSRGVTAPSQGSIIGAKAGGVGRQTPGAGGCVKKIGAFRPSFARNAIRLSATRVPNLTPASFDQPSGSCASDAAYAASRLACAYGEYVTRILCAAATAAARADAPRGARAVNR